MGKKRQYDAIVAIAGLEPGEQVEAVSIAEVGSYERGTAHRRRPHAPRRPAPGERHPHVRSPASCG